MLIKKEKCRLKLKFTWHLVFYIIFRLRTLGDRERRKRDLSSVSGSRDSERPAPLGPGAVLRVITDGLEENFEFFEHQPSRTLRGLPAGGIWTRLSHAFAEWTPVEVRAFQTGSERLGAITRERVVPQRSATPLNDGQDSLFNSGTFNDAARGYLRIRRSCRPSRTHPTLIDIFPRVR